MSEKSLQLALVNAGCYFRGYQFWVPEVNLILYATIQTDAGKQKKMKKTEQVHTNSYYRKENFFGPGSFLKRSFWVISGGRILPAFKTSRARLTFRVLEIVLQDDKSKKDLHLLGSEEAARACMLSVTEPEVS